MQKATRWKIIFGATFLLVMVGSLCANVYINESKFDFSAGQGSYESPDVNYKVTVRLCAKEEVEALDAITVADDIYVIARIYWEPAVCDDGVKVWESSRSRIIFYDKYTGRPCTVDWMDEKTVVINGETLDAAWERYDYRFNWN